MYSVPNKKVLLINAMHFNSPNNSAVVKIYVRESADNYIYASPIKMIYSVKCVGSQIDLKQYIRVPSKSDLFVTGHSDDNETEIYGSLSGYLVDDDGFMLAETGYDILLE